jgi:DNA-binding response OmpR family regulator
MGGKILVIDDDPDFLRVMYHSLKRESYEVATAASAEEGLRYAMLGRPNLVLLDVRMPTMDGWEVCRRLREMSNVPIIFLSASDSPDDVTRGLDMGGDDYVTKPFQMDELLARIKAHLRRVPSPSAAKELTFDRHGLTINFNRREVTVRGRPIELTPKEFDLLATLARNAERVMTRQELVSQAWGSDENSEAAEYLKLYILYLRRKIDPEVIVTARGVGYRFAAS